MILRSRYLAFLWYLNDWLVIPHISFRFILRSCSETKLSVWGSTLKLWGFKNIKMSSNIYAKIGIKKNRFRGRPGAKEIPELVVRRGLRGRASEEMKKGRNKESKKREIGDSKEGKGSTHPPDPMSRRICWCWRLCLIASGNGAEESTSVECIYWLVGGRRKHFVLLPL